MSAYDIDKRTARRFDCCVPVDSKTGSTFDGTQTIDICKDGIGFVSDKEIPLNERIAIELALSPDTEPVLVVGIVKWVRRISNSDQFRIGLTFSEVISGSRRTINSALKNSRMSFADMDDVDEELDEKRF